MKHPKTLRASVRHFGGGSPGTPYISDGDSARVLFFFNIILCNEGDEQLSDYLYNDYAESIVNSIELTGDE